MALCSTCIEIVVIQTLGDKYKVSKTEIYCESYDGRDKAGPDCT